MPNLQYGNVSRFLFHAENICRKNTSMFLAFQHVCLTQVYSLNPDNVAIIVNTEKFMLIYAI